MATQYALYFPALSTVSTTPPDRWRIATKTSNLYASHLCAEVVFRYYDNPATFQLYNPSLSPPANGMTLFHQGTDASTPGVAAILRKNSLGQFSLGMIYSTGTAWQDLSGSFVELSSIGGNVATDAFYFLMQYAVTGSGGSRATNFYLSVAIFNNASNLSVPSWTAPAMSISGDLGAGNQWGFGAIPQSITTTDGYIATEGYNCYVAQNTELSFLRSWNTSAAPPVPLSGATGTYSMFNSDANYSLYRKNKSYSPVTWAASPSASSALNFQLVVSGTPVSVSTVGNSGGSASTVPVTLTTSSSSYPSLGNQDFALNSSTGYILSQPTTIPCLLKGTLILTPDRGEVAIEELQVGDTVLTHTGTISTIRNLTSSTLASTDRSAPYLIPAGHLGATRDLYLSPRHSVLLANLFVPAEELTFPVPLQRMTEHKVITYYHLNTDNYWSDTLVANGVPVETWNGRLPWQDKPLEVPPAYFSAQGFRILQPRTLFLLVG